MQRTPKDVFKKPLTAEELVNFREEASITANMMHPHIVTVFAFNEITVSEATIPYLVMAFAPQGSLKQRHPLGERLSLNTIMEYLEQIVDALAFIHEHRLVHLDLKPANLLIGANNEILLGDFGIAKFFQNTYPQRMQLSENDLVGTVIYMAPERFKGPVGPGPAADQYALGIILFEWLTGESPFYGTDTQIVLQHIHASVPSLRTICPDIPLSVEQVVLKALSKDPYARFKNVWELFLALDEARNASSSRPWFNVVRVYRWLNLF